MNVFAITNLNVPLHQYWPDKTFPTIGEFPQNLMHNFIQSIISNVRKVLFGLLTL